MTDQQIMGTILAVARRIKGFTEGGMTPATMLRDEARHGLDSLGRVELSLGVEEAFGIRIGDEDFDRLGTVQDFIDLIKAQSQ